VVRAFSSGPCLAVLTNGKSSAVLVIVDSAIFVDVVSYNILSTFTLFRPLSHFLKYHIPAFISLWYVHPLSPFSLLTIFPRLHIGFAAAAILRDSKIREGFVQLPPVDHDGELEQASSAGHDAQLTDTQNPMHDVKVPSNVLRATIGISPLGSGFTTVGIYSYA
jgi:hypothetical protein